MRTSISGGLPLVVAAPLLVGLNALLDLEVESVVLLGAAVGAVVALVPDRSPVTRLLGFLAGVAIAWLSFVVRAGFLPDSSTGRALAIALALGLCVLLVLVTRDRLPLWSLLVGVAGVAGAYEFTFAAAPTEVLSSSLSTVTSLLVTAAVGFLACSLVPGSQREDDRSVAAHRDDTHDHELTMENNA